MPWLLSAISARFIWAVSNLIDKALLEKYIRQPLLYLWINGLVGALPTALIFFVPVTWPSWSLVPVLAVTGMICIYVFLPYYKALQLAEASRVVPLWHLVPLLALILGVLFLGESVSWLQLIGVVSLVCGGLLLVGDELFPLQFNSAVGFMLLADALYAVELILMKYVYTVAPNFSTGLVWLSASATLALLPSLFVKRWRQGLWQHWQGLPRTIKSISLGNGMLNITAAVLNEFTISQVVVALASAVDSTQSVFVLVFGLLVSRRWPKVFHEQTQFKKILPKFIAIIFMALGLYFIV